MASVPATSRPQRLVVYGVSWREYTHLLRAFAEHPGYRLTYDRGALEIMSPLFEHEADADLLGCFVVVLTEEMGLSRVAGRSTTFRKRRLQRGLEPDHCWWIANAAAVIGKKRINLNRDPPPDLALEVEVTRRVVKRMPLYARLQIPEVWRRTVRGLVFDVLQPDGQFAAQTHSRAFPWLTPADLLPFLDLRSQHDDNEVVRCFRAFVRQRLAGGTAPAP